MQNNQIRWNFIVEKASWWGGFGNASLVVLKMFKADCWKIHIDIEEMRMLVEIECMLNNRPLTYLYDEIEGVSQPLTPADLIYGRHIVETANGRHFEVISSAQSLIKRVRYQARLLSSQIAYTVYKVLAL